MPLEQLLAQYGYIMPNGANSSNAQASSSQAQAEAATTSSRQQRRKAKEHPGSADRPAKRQRSALEDVQPESIAPQPQMSAPQAPASHPQGPHGPLQQSTSGAGSDRMSDSGSEGSSADLRSLVELSEQAADTALGVPSSNGPAANRPVALGALVKGPTRDADEMQSGSDFDSVAAGSNDGDDEQTLEEEERLAEAEDDTHNVGNSWLTARKANFCVSEGNI